ncbi:MAG TPA: MerR family transcriptional regulator, partial [Thermoanaerobaculia bacterium]|nr:MerR family transcriptional regulator [Thermoanaerobaculia bacterium]
MKGYSTREVAGLLELSEADVRGYVRAGLLSPARGPGRALRFSFQDLVVLRTAGGLARAGVAPRRIRRALSRLRDQVPEGGSLTSSRLA